MTKSGEWAVIRRRADGLEGTPDQQDTARRRIESKKAYRIAQRSDGQLVLERAIREAALVILAGRPRPTTCEVCEEPNQDKGPVHFDHDHATGVFRGWLCVRCNHTLGKSNDSPVLLRKLADYLENPPGATIEK